jgi:uncharacterized protein
MKKTLIITLACLSAASFAAEKKRVVVCTVTTGFRHSSIPFAEKALEKIGTDSGIYEIIDWSRQPKTEVPQRPAKPKDLKPDADDNTKTKYAAELKKYEEEQSKWTPEKEMELKAAEAKREAEMKESMAKLSPGNLKSKKVDLVIFANTTGDLPLPDKEGFMQWIQDGGNFAAMHSGSDTFHGFRPFIDMLQGEFETHGAQVPADLIAADKVHPAVEGLPSPWNIKQEEMYIIKSQDRSKVRSLWYMNHHPNDASKAGFFPVSWVRMHGKGRVFYTNLGHREDLWSDDPALRDRINSVETSKEYHKHLLGGIKWALGLANGDATPNPDVK